MGSLSNYMENVILDHVLRTTTYPFDGTSSVYIGLSTADPTEDGSGIAEPSSGGYARVEHLVWDVASARATENTGTISFPVITAGWGTITHFFISDSLTGGNMLAHGALTVPKTILSGESVSFQDGSLDISFAAGGASTWLSNALLDHIFKTTEYDTTTSIFIALSTANPTDDASGMTEPVGGSYARKEFTTFNAAAAGATDNNGEITFNTATGSWGTITYFAIYDSLTGGNMLLYSALDISRLVTTSDTPSFADGALDITLD